MKSSKIDLLRSAIEDWAKIHQIDAKLIEVKPGGVGSNIHILLVARQGFENWPATNVAATCSSTCTTMRIPTKIW